MKNTKKKTLSLLLTAVMICSLLPSGTLTALATSVPDSNRYDLADGSITISAGTNSGVKVTYGSPSKDDIPFTENIEIFCSVASSSNTVTVSGGLSGTVNITLNDANIDVSGTPGACAFSIGSGTTVSLKLSGSSSLTSGYNSAGLHVPVGAVLTVIKNSTGSLSANGGSAAAGIGGASGETGGTITIEDGTVTATGGMSGAGIGGGCNGAGGTIAISGGTVNASAGGGGGGAGIGGGYDTEGGIIKISGGSVTASSEAYGAGIGGGMYASGGKITIEDGTVIATGGESGAGIGGGKFGAGGIISIEGGSVTATSLTGDVGGGAGIGGGNTGAGGAITISKGIVKATGDASGAGIGGGRYGNGGTIEIKGGTVTAQGGESSAGVGSGDGYYADPAVSAGTITISEGTVMATGGKNGAGIGGGDSSDGGTIKIDGGTVTAQGGSGGAGIGGGKSGAGGDITINNEAVIKAVSNGTTRPAIYAISSSLNPAGTAKVLMVNFAAQKNANANTSINIKDNSSVYSGVTPKVKYQSVAFTVSAGTYRLKSANLLQQKTSTNTGIDYVISAAGLTVFSGVTAAKTYTVGIGALSGGSITPSQTSAAAGETISLTITPTAGMLLKAGSLVYNDGTDNAITGTSFTMPAVNVTIKAKFELPSHSVTVSADPALDGKVSGGGTYSEGASVTVTATPSLGCTFVNWTEGVNEVSKDSSYSFSMGTSDRILVANFTAANVFFGGSHTTETSKVKVAFDNVALAVIDKITNGNYAVEVVKVSDLLLSDTAKEQIGSRPVYNISVVSGGTKISDFGGGKATVSIPYTLATGEDANKIVIYYISGDGELVMVPNCQYDDSTGMASFTTAHFSTYAVGYNDVSFTDVSGWYTDYVNFLAARGIVSGIGNGIFSPDANITRAQFVTILARMSGDDLSGYSVSSFSDVAATDWCFAAVQWAYKNGIASGSDGNFTPGANITREQMAVMLYNYAKYAGTDVSNAAGMSVGKFTDYASISSWALEPIQWAINNSIISGNSDGSFAPTDNGTRAEAAKMIALLLQGMIGI